MNDAQRQALRAAAALGGPCFPCFPDKRPACPRGFKDAALREAGLATLWTRHPGELIGVPTGSVSGVAVLDVDRDKGGGEWWAANRRACRRQGFIERGRGVCIACFVIALASGVARAESPLVSTCAEGGYVVWWPATGLEVLDQPIAEWPAWLEPAKPAPAPKATRPAAAAPRQPFPRS